MRLVVLMPDQSDVQIVITVPGSNGLRIAHEVGTRTTLGVLTTLIAQAEHSLVLAAPFMQTGEGLNQEPLAGALLTALSKGVAIDLASTGAGLDTLDKVRLRNAAKRRVRFFQPASNVDDATKLGMHAKFCVADANRAYVGSANLTKPGLQEHFEMGVLVQGSAAAQVDELWRYLVDREFFVEI